MYTSMTVIHPQICTMITKYQIENILSSIFFLRIYENSLADL